MHPGRSTTLRILAVSAILLATAKLNAQDDGGVSVGIDDHGRGQELLESIFVPYLPNAPFSLTLATEWSRPMSNGGSYTVVNSRPSSATASDESTRNAGSSPQKAATFPGA